MTGNFKTRIWAANVAGFPLPVYLGVLALVIACMYTDCLPAGLVGGIIVLMVVGEGLNAIGNSLPVVRTYLGGSVICILGAAAIRADPCADAGYSEQVCKPAGLSGLLYLRPDHRKPV